MRFSSRTKPEVKDAQLFQTHLESEGGVGIARRKPAAAAAAVAAQPRLYNEYPFRHHHRVVIPTAVTRSSLPRHLLARRVTEWRNPSSTLDFDT